MSTRNPVEDLVLSKNISQYCQVALLTLLVYDTIVTMEKEVKYIWSHPSTFVSITYFANRYIGILGAICGVISKTFIVNHTMTHIYLCKDVRTHFIDVECDIAESSSGSFSKWSELLADWATFLLIEYVLLTRVIALYSRGKTATRCFRILFAVEASYTLGLLIYVVIYEKIGVVTLSEEGLAFCGGVGDNRPIPKTYAAAWAPPLIYDFIFMFLSLYKAVEFWKEAPGSTGTDLVKVLIRHQALYFALLIINTFAQILSEVLKPSMVTTFLSVLGNPLVLCVLGSHLVISLKEVGEKGENGGTTGSTSTLSVMEFS